MTSINPEAVARREAARVGGKFGTQAHTAPDADVLGGGPAAQVRDPHALGDQVDTATSTEPPQTASTFTVAVPTQRSTLDGVRLDTWAELSAAQHDQLVDLHGPGSVEHLDVTSTVTGDPRGEWSVTQRAWHHPGTRPEPVFTDTYRHVLVEPGTAINLGDRVLEVSACHTQQDVSEVADHQQFDMDVTLSDGKQVKIIAGAFSPDLSDAGFTPDDAGDDDARAIAEYLHARENVDDLRAGLLTDEACGSFTRRGLLAVHDGDENAAAADLALAVRPE